MAAHFSRSASLMGYRELVASLGGEPDRLLEDAGIDPQWLTADDNLMPSETLVALLERSADTLGCEDFGIQLAKRQSLSMLGPVGLLVQQCTTLGEALKQLQRFLYIHSQAAMIDISLHNEQCLVTMTPLVEYQGRDRQLIDLTLTAGLSILGELLGRPIPVESVCFAYRRPANLQVYNSVFRCPLAFEEERSGVVLSRQVLDWPLKSGGAHIQNFVKHYIARIEAAHPAQLESRVRALIRQLLPLGQCSMGQLASVLGVEPRTLQRRLSEKGLSYRRILNEEREQLARRYLDESEVSLRHLADLLGFEEQSVFSRSFRQWTGQTPTAYMKQRGRRLHFRDAVKGGG